MLNVSYNDAIKHAKVSKGTVYKLFKSEDELQKETLAYYDEVYINKLETAASLSANIFDFLAIWKSKISENNYMPCYFFISNTKKSMLGIKTKKYLNKIETKFKRLFSNMIKRHIKLRKIIVKKNIILELTLFLFHNFTLINNLILNDADKKDISVIEKSIIEKTKSCLS